LLGLSRQSKEEEQLGIADFTHSLEFEKNATIYRAKARAEEFLGQNVAAQADRAAADEFDGKSD
jgi:hypothetical protein